MLYRMQRTARTYARMFQRYDVVLSPVLSHTTPKLGYLSPAQDFDTLFDRLVTYAAFTPLNNASGGPAISLPLHQTSTGMPLASHFSAAHGDERTLLDSPSNSRPKSRGRGSRIRRDPGFRAARVTPALRVRELQNPTRQATVIMVVHPSPQADRVGTLAPATTPTPPKQVPSPGLPGHTEDSPLIVMQTFLLRPSAAEMRTHAAPIRLCGSRTNFVAIPESKSA
ncbi:hypothetical protein M2280_001997 [Prescottella agglutinans]|uniref:Amidase domain-containing protein n=1 Tax=Prescottella agglutinans TaxID=1644129 RepID=A0ABT6MA21_9NOCA|nr:hypothetical protein [Prescottella agglutinans]